MESGGGQIEQGKHVLVEIGAWQIDEALEHHDPDLLVALAPTFDETDEANASAACRREGMQIDRLPTSPVAK